MKKNLKLLVLSFFVILVCSVIEKIEGMEDSIKYKDQESSLRISLFNQEKENITEHNKIVDETKLNPSKYGFLFSLISGASNSLKEGINFTIDHPMQTVILGLASLAETASCDPTEVENNTSWGWWMNKEAAVLMTTVAIPIVYQVWKTYITPRNILVEGHTRYNVGHTTHIHVFTNDPSGRLK